MKEKTNSAKTEKHPLPPFLPDKAEYLFLGSFPPKRQRWSMEFFYPNFQNDMWRIFGLIFFNDRNYFVNIEEKTFKKEEIIAFLTKRRIAVYDTAKTVMRLKDNASDKDLEVIEQVDLEKIIRELPCLRNIVATGQKAMETVVRQFADKNIRILPPAVGGYTAFIFDGRKLRLYRMPSSSRAYPLATEKKAEIYEAAFALSAAETIF